MTDHTPNYLAHLRAAYDWLERSRSPRDGGSRASFSPLRGWSRTYPETTGYIIPTVLACGAELGDIRALSKATRFGEFLLTAQRDDGAWNGHLHPARHPQASVFNTAQILKGMCALARVTGQARWYNAARRGARWLRDEQQSDAVWARGNYQTGFNPSYYTQVAWPILEVAQLTGDQTLSAAAERALTVYERRRSANGMYSGWGFGGAQPAFTHTIAYTLRGFLESGRLLDQPERFHGPVSETLAPFRDEAIERRGRIGGAYFDDRRAQRSFVCLTGNAQLAICMMIVAEHDHDPRWIEAATALLDEVCSHHATSHVVPALRGAVAGSAPLWGRYMRFRYPNWAAKYLCDALLRIVHAGRTTARERPPT